MLTLCIKKHRKITDYFLPNQKYLQFQLSTRRRNRTPHHGDELSFSLVTRNTAYKSATRSIFPIPMPNSVYGIDKSPP